MIDQLLLADLMLRLRCCNLLLLERTINLVLVVAELLSFDHLLFNDLRHLYWHSVDTFRVALLVSLLLLLVPRRTQDTGNVLSSFGRVLSILCLTDFELLFKVVILMFQSILLIILCIDVIRKRLPWLLLLQSLCLLPN